MIMAGSRFESGQKEGCQRGMGAGEIADSSALPVSGPGEQQTGVETGQSQGAPQLSKKALTTSSRPPPALPLQTDRLPLRLGAPLGIFLAVQLLSDPTRPGKAPRGRGLAVARSAALALCGPVSGSLPL